MSQKSKIKWLWNRMKNYRIIIWINSLIGIFRVAVSLFMVWVCKQLVDSATHEGYELTILLVLLVLCLIVQLVLTILDGHLKNELEIRMRIQIETELFDKVMRGNEDERYAMHTADIINRIEQDVPIVTGTLCRELPYSVTGLCQLLGAFVFLYSMDSNLSFILVGMTPLVLVVSKMFLRKMQFLSSEIRTTDSEIQIHFQESLQNRILISIMEYISSTEKKLSFLQSKLQKQVMQRTHFIIYSRTIVHIGFSIGYLTAFIWGVYGLKDGTVSFGMMTAFLQLVAQLQRPIFELSKQLPTFARTLTSVERLMEIQNLFQNKIEESDNFKNIATGIRIENVCFSYHNRGYNVLENFNHDFTPGSFTAIIGETGIGKSTLFKLILALMKPSSGRVVFYNNSHENEVVASSDTRHCISYVPQNNVLLTGTIKENLLMGCQCATDEDLCVALHAAVADFVYTLPQGINTQCGEKNDGLSEGQVQRIAIARALLRPGNILLLDEPTSALDKETERLLLERLSNLKKTVIIITHSEYVTQFCNQVVRIGK